MKLENRFKALLCNVIANKSQTSELSGLIVFIPQDYCEDQGR